MDVEAANATAVKNALISYYKNFLGMEAEDDINFASKGWIGAGADGAAVNFGVHRGMMTQLKVDLPWLVAVHCVAHRLELAIKDAFKDSYFIQQVFYFTFMI